MKAGQAVALTAVSNDGQFTIEKDVPYVAEVELEGVCSIIFHRWSVDDVQAKTDAKKGSAAKREDNLEAYVARNADGEICIPSDYISAAIVHAAKFKQDPRSPRKSAMDLFKAGVAPLDELCSTGKTNWEFIDRRHMVVQRNGITRCRPALYKGWKIRCSLQVHLPEYISPQLLHETLCLAGRVTGLADSRPTYGRFLVTNFKVVPLE